MKSFRSIALVLCMTLLVTLSCREELFELAGDHDIRIIYANDSTFSTTSPFWVRSYSGRIEFEDPSYPTYYLEIENTSDSVVTITSMAWDGTTPASITLSPQIFSLTAGERSVYATYPIQINCTFSQEEAGTVMIRYSAGGKTREFPLIVECYL